MVFDNPGFWNYLVPPQVSLNNLTTTYQDTSSAPLIVKYSTKALVSDELGNVLTDAIVTGMPQLAGSDPNVYAFTKGYYWNLLQSLFNLSISRNGYVTQNGSTGNTGFMNVPPAGVLETIVSVTGPQNQPCTTVPFGQTTICAALQLDTHVTVKTAGGALIPGATVSFLNAGTNVVSDDLAKNPGSGDAMGTTDASGVVKMALNSASLDLNVSASSYTTKTTAVTITDGVLNDLVVTLTPLVVIIPVDTNPSASISTVIASPAMVTADDTSASTVTVTVKNAQGQGLPGKTVTLSAVLSGLTVTPSSATTDASGVATFGLTSTNAGTVSVTASVSGMAISQTASVQFTTTPVVPSPVEQGVSCQQSIKSGALLKLPDDADPNTQADTAVYYIGTDCKRHAFPNSKVYFSWYADFAGVTTVPGTTMSSFSLGKNVTYRPGSKMVKFQSLNTVYVIAKGGVLRWVKTEAAASGLYGSDWNKKVDDISDAFFTNYAFGADVNVAADFSAATEQTMTPSISDNF